jgi:UDP-N-acetylmuramoyl-tripeptide--D-alanyl-D-alanine ligase
MKQSGILFLNSDDKNSKFLLSKNFPGKVVKVGINNAANYRATNVSYTAGGMTFKVKLDGYVHSFFIPIYGKHNVYNALFAIAVANTLGFNSEEIKAGLRLYQKPAHRLRVYKLKNGITLIDDTFNANPNSVNAALNVLTSISKAKNVAILGSMSELGSYTQKGHAMVGRYAVKKANLDYLYTYGGNARQIANTAIKAGFPRYRVIATTQRGILHKSLKRNLQPGTTILVKGSHSMGMNKTAGFIKSRYS